MGSLALLLKGRLGCTFVIRRSWLGWTDVMVNDPEDKIIAACNRISTGLTNHRCATPG